MVINKKQYMKIKKAAFYCQQFTQTQEPFTALRNLEIEYSIINLNGKLPGFTDSHHTPDGKYFPHVYINKRYNLYSQKIIASHELGHVIIHKKDTMNMLDPDADNDIREYEANIFAMEFLTWLKPVNYLKLSPKELQEYIFSKLYLT